MMPRDRRALQIGAGVIGLGLLALRIAPAAVGAESRLRARVAEREAVVSRLNADVASMAALEDSAKQVQRAVVQLAPRLVPGGTASEANAALDATVRSMLERAGARIDRVGPVADTTTVGGISRVGARVQGESDTRGLEAALRALATDPLALEVTALRVSAANAASPPSQPERLSIELTVKGWRLVSRDSAKRRQTAGRSGGDR
jgi:hypothetical protein